jgi:hypothetical protein
MSSLSNEPDGSQALTFTASLPQIQIHQKELTDTPKSTPLQQRKKDALDMAELIYAIYNSNCPIKELNRNQGGKNDI